MRGGSGAKHSRPSKPPPAQLALTAARRRGVLQKGVGSAPRLEQRAHGRPDPEAGAGADQPVGPGPFLQVGRRPCNRAGCGSHPAGGAAALRQPVHAALVLKKANSRCTHDLYVMPLLYSAALVLRSLLKCDKQ